MLPRVPYGILSILASGANAVLGSLLGCSIIVTVSAKFVVGPTLVYKVKAPEVTGV